MPRSPAEALALLASLGASPWLVRHHELVLEAADLLTRRLAGELKVSFAREEVLLGAALHDAGKVLHPSEMSEPGHQHEPAGQELLLSRGVPPWLARICVTHAAWRRDDLKLEELLVALADTLWKGSRVPELESRVMQRIAELTGQQAWQVFDRLDAICEAVAADGPERLERSRVGSD
ncbi:HD domain-containing protein [Pyxidicoccus fallax]|uniref:HD domain-containing protein n=1 Tax=Pyxidicoccus fallax TaxID=394095 RepID=A0A848LYB9_9BACT|nr:HD domain-containing protein [Pyxidicoccus fallax]NMO22619.1 HD domain-containing protein [Pyxidicoccus fallax]NPC84647.1 HD domain-containing protein [Pyxidicoccus fallax]